MKIWQCLGRFVRYGSCFVRIIMTRWRMLAENGVWHGVCIVLQQKEDLVRKSRERRGSSKENGQGSEEPERVANQIKCRREDEARELAHVLPDKAGENEGTRNSQDESPQAAGQNPNSRAAGMKAAKSSLKHRMMRMD